MWIMELSLADQTKNEIRSLGGAGYLTEGEALRVWRTIPSVPDSRLILDLIDPQGDIVEDKQVTIQTAEMLLGKRLF